MEPIHLTRLNEERRNRRAAILLTDLGDGRDRLIGEGDEIGGELGVALAKAFLSGKSATLDYQSRKLFLNVHVPPPKIVAVGAVHISQALAPMARTAGFDVEIIDPRTAFATPQRFAGTLLHAEWPEEALKRRPLDRYTALAALTHDPKIDDFPLLSALGAGCFYVGALGSRKTHATRRARLLEQGGKAAALDRIAAPIGIDIGASSPAEIAVAILAEIIAAFHRRGLGGDGAQPS